MCPPVFVYVCPWTTIDEQELWNEFIIIFMKLLDYWADLEKN